MLVTRLLALALVPLVAAAPPELGFSGDVYMGTVYTDFYFRGLHHIITYEDRCIDLTSSVRSIEIDPRGHCTLYRTPQCGRSKKFFDESDRDIWPSNWRSVRCSRKS